MEILPYVIAGAIILYVFGKLVFFIRARKHKWVKLKPKLPGTGYRLIYTDQKQVEKEEGVLYGKPLKSEKLDITGKPDYIYEQKDGALYPVELKSGAIKESDAPHFGDLMQLAAYFAITGEYFDRPVYEGLIVYKDYMFRIKNTKRLRHMLKATLSDMRGMLKSGEGEPAASFVSCKNCICKGTVCEYFE